MPGRPRPDPGMDADTLDLRFHGELWTWRGPAPFYSISVPDDASATVRAIAPAVTYGWGVIPVEARIGGSVWRPSLFPKDGRYLVPVKAAVRAAEGLAEGDVVTVWLSIGG